MQRTKLSKIEKKAIKLFGTVVFLICASWSVLQPAYGVSDEPAHVIKALATVSGQLSGTNSRGEFKMLAGTFRVPEAYKYVSRWRCYHGDLTETPDCAVKMPTSRSLAEVKSTASQYPPFYYSLVGWVGWIFVGSNGVLAMRLLTSLIFASLATLAGYLLVINRIQWGLVALLAGVTPLVTAFAGSVNPYAPEIGSALVFWTASLLYLRDKNQDKRLQVINLRMIYLSALLFGLFRPGSFVWMFPILGLVVLTTPSLYEAGKLRLSLGRAKNICIAGIVSIGISFCWFRFGMQEEYRGLGGWVNGVGGNLFSNLRYSFERTDDFFIQVFGYFGWTEFFPPLIVPLLILMSICLMWVHFGTEKPQIRLPLFLAILFVFSAPMALEGARAAQNGWGFQGRYLLPVIVGIPLLVAICGEVRVFSPKRMAWAITGILAAHGIAMNHALRRFFSGLDGQYMWFEDIEWRGLVGLPILLILLTATLAASFSLMRCVPRLSLEQE